MASSGARIDAKFWAVADLFREKGAVWIPTNAGFEFRCVKEVEGKPWTLCFKVHVVQANHVDRRKGLRFKSSVSLWPPSLSKAEERRLRESGWYKTNEEAISREGYEGRWHSSPNGTFGDFWKDLASLAEIRREVTRLEKIRLDLPSSSRRRPRKVRPDDEVGRA